jgi:hypothetical protein
MLLHRQDAREALPATEPSHATAAGDERTHAPYVTPCERCHGTRWGPVAPAVTETLRTGDEVLTEVWGCLACEARPEGTPAPPVPETMSVPPASVDSPCGECGTLMEETQSEGPAESRWQCPACGWSIICPARPEGKPAPPVPEPLTTPPWATPNPCPKCDKAYRLFVPGSTHTPGEPERDVLICSQCGHAELACRDCKGTHIVVDSKGLYCPEFRSTCVR